MTAAILAVKRRFEAAEPGIRWFGAAASLLIVAFVLVALPTREALGAWWQTAAPWQRGFTASLAAGLATGVGAIAVFFARSVPARLQDAMLGFGAGVMLAATSFSLILPGIEVAHLLTQSAAVATAIVAGGMGLGGLFLFAADRIVPHEHFIKGRKGCDTTRVRRIWLFVLAIALHNVPEGLAVGVAFGGGDAAASHLALGIGLQNIPEGLAVALALAAAGHTRASAFVVALATGLIEPVAGLFGALVVGAAQWLLPWGLAFAAGAMLFVISHEVIPESHRRGYETPATAGILAGFVAMMMLDTAL